jgi:hypothetical protein
VMAKVFRRNRGFANRSLASAGRRWVAAATKSPLGNHSAENRIQAVYLLLSVAKEIPKPAALSSCELSVWSPRRPISPSLGFAALRLWLKTSA